VRWWPVLAVVAGCSFHFNSAGTAPTDTSRPDDAPSDARIDADAAPDAGFDPATCPASYTTTVTATPGSRYRVIATAQDWGSQRADCEDDLAGATHLVVFDSDAEAQQIAAAVGAINYHVGAVQPAGESGVAVGWVWLTGAPVPSGLWQAGQPNDNDGIEDDEQDRTSVYASVGYALQDVDAPFSTQAVCECDGHPVAPAVLAILQ